MTKTPGTRLLELRDQNYLSHAEVAKRIGVSERTVYGWEHDQYAPTGKHLRALGELYRVAPEWIEAGIEPAPPNIMELLEQNNRLLRAIDAKMGALAQTVAKPIPPLTTEQLAALARLEQLTQRLDQLLPARPQQPAGS